jgi:hypothetical protein
MFVSHFSGENILSRNRCQVRSYEGGTIQVLYWGDMPYSAGIKERLLQMAPSEAFQTFQGRGEAGNGDKGRTPEDP